MIYTWTEVIIVSSVGATLIGQFLIRIMKPNSHICYNIILCRFIDKVILWNTIGPLYKCCRIVIFVTPYSSILKFSD